MTTLHLDELHAHRRRFLELVAVIRPDLHRYCARMTGSVTDGEDVVQDTLARAYFVLAELDEVPPLRPWLFRIAHHRAIDHLRREGRRASALFDDQLAIDEHTLDAEDALVRVESVALAISRFVALPPAQRSCVILKDVLGHSLDEIGVLLDLTVPAVKAALHRGRVRLQQSHEAKPRSIEPASPELARYAALFNARDWDGVRGMLAEDVRLDLVSRAQRSGREVESYFANYDTKRDWHFVAARLDGREVLAVTRDAGDAEPRYFVELRITNGRVTFIRDYRYVPYIAEDAALTLSP